MEDARRLFKQQARKIDTMTQMKEARSGVITPEMKIVADKEQVDPVWLRDQVADLKRKLREQNQ